MEFPTGSMRTGEAGGLEALRQLGWGEGAVCWRVCG